MELGVTSGAITQHVHTLEKHLNRRLVERSGRGIELTVWGKCYLPRLTLEFAELGKALEDLERGSHSNHLVISTYPSLATKWLGPLMFGWKALHPDATAMLAGVHPEPRLDDGEADFRISYGNRYRHHARYTRLYSDHVLTVASPALLARVGNIAGPRELLRWPLLWVDWGNEYVALPSWHDWFSAVGIDASELNRDLVFSLPSAAVDCRRGKPGLRTGAAFPCGQCFGSWNPGACASPRIAARRIAFSRLERRGARQPAGEGVPRLDHRRVAALRQGVVAVEDASIAVQLT